MDPQSAHHEVKRRTKHVDQNRFSLGSSHNRQGTGIRLPRMSLLPWRVAARERDVAAELVE